MIGRVLVDTDDWMIVAGLLGGIKATLKLRDITIKANRHERNHLFNILDEMRARDMKIEPNSPEFTTAMIQFAEALFGQGDARWQAYFQHLTASEIADSLRPTKREILRENIAEGLMYAELDNQVKEQAFLKGFGCDICRSTPTSETTYQDLPFAKVECLYGSSHESYWLSECSHCHQKYLESFHDKIDWSGEGNDPMWNSWTPLRDEDISILTEHSGDLSNLREQVDKRIRLLLEPSGSYSWVTYNNSSNLTDAQNAPPS